MTFLRMGFAILLVALLSACARNHQDDPRPRAWLKPGVQVTLPDPGMEKPFSQQQLLTATIKGKDHALLVLLNVDQQQLTLAGLSSLGIRLFSLVYDQTGVHVQQSIVVPEIPPANQVLQDIMLSYWPISAWQPLLPTGWTLTDEGDNRHLRDDKGEVIVEIHYQQLDGLRQPVLVQQNIFKYKIAIQHLDEAS